MSSAQRRRPAKGRRERRKGTGAAPTPQVTPREYRGFWTPSGIALGIILLSFLPRINENPLLTWSFWGAGLAIIIWQIGLLARRKGEVLSRTLVFATPRPQHYIQAMVQISVFAYWGWYWRPVYDMAWLILAQLAFAYAFDMLLSWSRRESYVLGFGPFPIIFSINLFLWFRDDWFYLQFLMIGLGFLGKEFIRWEREGRRVHIFNPSAFSLGLFSLALILAGGTHLTWGPEIASTLTLAPRIYLFLFLTGLVVMYFFSITLVAGSAAVTLFALSALYSQVTGVPYFLDSEIPAAVFLGLHLLITDPSTSPRTPPGKLVFGTLYGVSVFGLYAFLGMFGAPTFYDKLLAVPLLNLSVRAIDHAVARVRETGSAGGLKLEWTPARTNLALMGVWIVFFSGMTSMGKTDGRHTGDSLPFWEQACVEGKRNACDRLIQLETAYCADNSGWACNALGGHYAEGRIVEQDREAARRYFSQSCELRFQAGCVNLLEEASVAHASPRALDLRLLLREGGRNLLEMPEADLYARACDHRWDFACERTARLP